jgi:multidrug efflux pump subunit AcrB
VRDGFPPQTNIVRVNGQRSVLLTIQKAGDASTLDVISGIKSILPRIVTTVPSQLKMSPLADQSIFVKGAISGVVREALIAACLTAFMILMFLGKDTPEPRPIQPPEIGSVVAIPQVGGLHHRYERRAA